MPPQASDDPAPVSQTWLRSPSEAALIERLVAFLAPRMADLRATARSGMPPPAGELTPRLYVYWAQGFAAAPDVVRACHRRLLHMHDPAQVVSLDDGNVRDLVDLPDHVWQKLGPPRLTALSDVLRLDLLGRHGGVWVDATCWAETELPAAVRPLCASGFFAFRRRRRPLTSWLLAGEAGDETVLLWRQALLAYWEQFDRPLNYFLLHYLFAALCDLDEGFAARWEATPRVSARAAHRFQRAMGDPYDDARYQRLRQGSFVHKLTYKVEPAALGPGTMLGHLVREAGRRRRPLSGWWPPPGARGRRAPSR